MSSASKKSTMASDATKAEQGYENYMVLFEVFPDCQHVHHVAKKLLVVNPEVRNIELVLKNVPCPHFNQKDTLPTIQELLESCKAALGEALYDQTTAWDEFDILAHRWKLDIVYIEQVIWAFDDQNKAPSLPLVYNNHYHNARQQADSRLQSLKGKSPKSNTHELYLSRWHSIQSEWTKIEGEHLGRTWVDMAKSEPEAAAVSLAPGDISIVLNPRHELESIVDSTRIRKILHYRVKYAGDPEVSKWQPLSDFLDEQDLLIKYHNEHPRKARPDYKDWVQARASVWW